MTEGMSDRINVECDFEGDWVVSVSFDVIFGTFESYDDAMDFAKRLDTLLIDPSYYPNSFDLTYDPADDPTHQDDDD